MRVYVYSEWLIEDDDGVDEGMQSTQTERTAATISIYMHNTTLHHTCMLVYSL